MRASLENLKSLQPEVDYQALIAQLGSQTHPRRKIKELQNKGYLTRVKKGLYVFSKEFIGRVYSPEVVANLLYGPSYLSMEYALSFYGLIPERVEELTSVTSQKNKSFATPIGFFSYRHLASELYPLGVTLKESADGRSFLIATREKALLDIFTLKFKNSDRPRVADIEPALEDDLRVDLSELKKQLDRETLVALRPAYKNRPWSRLLIDFLLEEL